MSDTVALAAKPNPLAYLKNRAKAMIRPLIPAHIRFLRSAEEFYRHGEREVHALPDLIENGTIAVDVGANNGSYTYLIAKNVGSQGRVLTIEPVPDLADMIRKATAKLGLPVTLYNCALSSQPGEADLTMPIVNGRRWDGYGTLEKRGNVQGGMSYRVKLRTLDDICSEHQGRLSFIKIDVEGHELQVLRGGVETLKRRPNLLIEIEQRHSPVPINETFDFIKSQGFRGEFLDENNQPHPLETFEPAKHQDVSKVGTRSYVSNFIFKPLN